MIYLSTFLYYVFFASTVLIYGIGLNRIADLEYYSHKKITYFLKIIISIFLSSIASCFIVNKLLVPLELTELYPLICLFCFAIINTLIEGIMRIATGFSSTEFILSFIIVILSVAESHNIMNSIIISGSCLVSMAILIPIIFVFRKRMMDTDENKEKYLCRFFIFIAILILILSCWDIVWINPEVIQ